MDFRNLPAANDGARLAVVITDVTALASQAISTEAITAQVARKGMRLSGAQSLFAHAE